MPLSDQEDERNFYLDYKEIIDEMIEEKNQRNIANEFTYYGSAQFKIKNMT